MRAALRVRGNGRKLCLWDLLVPGRRHILFGRGWNELHRHDLGRRELRGLWGCVSSRSNLHRKGLRLPFRPDRVRDRLRRPRERHESLRSLRSQLRGRLTNVYVRDVSLGALP